jgi:hypothetical protein
MRGWELQEPALYKIQLVANAEQLFGRRSMRRCLQQGQVHMRDTNLVGMFAKESDALVPAECVEGGGGDGNSIEIRRRLDSQRGELCGHRQNVG